MSDIKLFSLNEGVATEVPGNATALEKSLQRQIEQNLDIVLGIRLLASEYYTGSKHHGRIDTLGIDENENPVIVEYKRATSENVINQGLFYLDWLLDHQAAFKVLVLEKLGTKAADVIDWSAPRLVCIAGGFTRYDEHAVKQINRNIDLIRYRRFGDKLLMLELVNATLAETGAANENVADVPPTQQRTISQTLATLDGPLQDLYETLRANLLALGDDVQEKTLKFYVAFKRLRNFACIDVHPNKAVMNVYLKVDPDTVALEQGFSRDVTNVGHRGTGDLELTIGTNDDLEKAKPILRKSYETN